MTDDELNAMEAEAREVEPTSKYGSTSAAECLATHILSLTEEVRRLKQQLSSLTEPEKPTTKLSPSAWLDKMLSLGYRPSVCDADGNQIHLDWKTGKTSLTEPDPATLPTRLDTNPPCVFMPGSVAT